MNFMKSNPSSRGFSTSIFSPLIYLLIFLVAVYNIHDTRLDDEMTAIFRTKLISLWSDDQQRASKIVEGYPSSRQFDEHFTYGVKHANGSQRSDREVADSVAKWLCGWNFCHSEDVSDYIFS